MRPKTAIPPQSTREVLGYFLRNPRTADTLEGITRWRLLEEVVQRTTEETGKAIAWLVSAGLLRRRLVPGGAPTYRLPAERKSEAERLLSTWVSSPDGDSGSSGSGR
ncbi:MAG: hypothetical protein ABUT39_28360 [Acidobacteriota bacterium]